MEDQSYLAIRYDDALYEADLRGADTQIQKFITALGNVKAVSNKKLSVLLRVCEKDNELFSNYYQLSKSVTLQNDELWDSPRQSTDTLFFTGYFDELSFAALTLDGSGLPYYGDCSVIYRTDLIEYRSSLFEENTTTFRIRERIVKAEEIPKGFRSVWADRVKLCVAKLAKDVDIALTPDKYSSLLMSPSSSGGDDRFVEVQIYGPITIRTIEKLTFTTKKRNKAENAIVNAIKNKAQSLGVKVH